MFKEDVSDFRRIQYEILVISIVIGAGLMIFTCGVMMNASNRILREKTIAMMKTNTEQTAGNIDTYIENINHFSDMILTEGAMNYDPTVSEDVDSRKALRAELARTEVIQNCGNLSILYSDGSDIGNVPKDLTYRELEKTVTGQGMDAAWYRSSYYIRQVNEHGIYVVALDMEKLEKRTMSSAACLEQESYLLNSEGIVIWASKGHSTGNPLSITKPEYLMSSSNTSNGFQVIMAVSEEKLVQESRRVWNLLSIAIFLLATGCIVLGIHIVNKNSTPFNAMVSNLSLQAKYDGLSGLLNKNSFKAHVQVLLNENEGYLTFVILDMDNFKQINDHLGHAKGDEVIHRFSQMLDSLFGAEGIIGRIGGDEFAICLECGGTDLKSAEQFVDFVMASANDAFKKEFETERREQKLSMSAGIDIVNQGEKDYDGIFAKADQALYQAKNCGKDCYIINKEQ